MSRLLKPLQIDDPRILIDIIAEAVDEIQSGATVLDTSLGNDESGCIDLIAADRDRKGMLFFINFSGQETDFLRSFKCLQWYQANRTIVQKLYRGAIDLSLSPSIFFISPYYSHSIQKVLLNIKEGQVTLFKYACFLDGEQIKIFLEKIPDPAGDENNGRNKDDGRDKDKEKEKVPAAAHSPVTAPETSLQTAPRPAEPDHKPKVPLMDLKKFRQEIGIDISNISDDELRDLIE